MDSLYESVVRNLCTSKKSAVINHDNQEAAEYKDGIDVFMKVVSAEIDEGDIEPTAENFKTIFERDSIQDQIQRDQGNYYV